MSSRSTITTLGAPSGAASSHGVGSGTFSGNTSVTGAGAGWAIGSLVRSIMSFATTCSFRDNTINGGRHYPNDQKLFRMPVTPTFVDFCQVTIPNNFRDDSSHWCRFDKRDPRHLLLTAVSKRRATRFTNGVI